MTIPPDEPDVPLAREDLSAFLGSDSSVTLFGTVDPKRRGAVVTANAALAALFPGAGAGGELESLLSGTGLARWRSAVEALGGTGRAQVVMLRLGRGGAGGASRSRFRCLLASGPGGTLWFVGERRPGTDDRVRRLAAARRRALVLARTDPLTGLGNRRQADRWLAALAADADRGGAPLTCLVVDLDRFKDVNDARGHPAGDRLLREAAASLAGAVRSGDRVARLGGDEFLVLLPGTGRAGAVPAAARLRAALPHPASVGAAAYRRGEGPAGLLGRADAALLRAKSAGRDRVEVDG